MTPKPPPPEGIALAWDLRRQNKSLVEVQQGLRAEGHDVVIDTVSRWCKLGAQAEEYIRIMEDDSIEEWHGLDRAQQRWMLASGLDKLISKWWDAVTLANGDHRVLDTASTHLRWALEFRAKLTNAYAPGHPGQPDPGSESPRPLDEVLEAIRKTMERQQQTVDDMRNGGSREQT